MIDKSLVIGALALQAATLRSGRLDRLETNAFFFIKQTDFAFCRLDVLRVFWSYRVRCMVKTSSPSGMNLIQVC